MAKILHKKNLYSFEKDCEDEFGKYHWYFRVYRCFSIKGISYSIETSDMFTNQKRLKDCLDTVLEHLEEDNPRYYRLKDKVIGEGLHNKLWQVDKPKFRGGDCMIDTTGNSDNLKVACMALDIFTKSWCIDCEFTKKT